MKKQLKLQSILILFFTALVLFTFAGIITFSINEKNTLSLISEGIYSIIYADSGSKADINGEFSALDDTARGNLSWLIVSGNLSLIAKSDYPEEYKTKDGIFICIANEQPPELTDYIFFCQAKVPDYPYCIFFSLHYNNREYCFIMEDNAQHTNYNSALSLLTHNKDY